MKAIIRLRAASYGPETIQAMLRAFDAAWAAVHFHFNDGPDSYEAARLTLANAILRAAADGNRDVAQLKNAGIASIAAHYRLEPSELRLGGDHATARE